MEDQVMMPPGFRFYPTEEELVGFYLREKLHRMRNNQLERVIPVLNIYEYNPWDLPQLSGSQCRQDPQLQEWFFFIPRQEKEARGGRPNRLTSTGYWKATGSPGYVYSFDKQIIGEKRTMVFYKGRAPGSKTYWKMNEYRAIDHGDTAPLLRLEFSLCRVYIRSKLIRSFDRRPSSSEPEAIRRRSSSRSMVVDHHDAHQRPLIAPSSSSHKQNTPVDMITKDGNCSSRENSSSSDDQNASNDVNKSGICDMDVNMDDAPLWEWDQYLNISDWMVI